MAPGKSAEGAEHARFCALYGLPGRIDYEEYVTLMLAEDAAVAALARVTVTALSMDKGAVGPREFYATEKAYLEALLRSRLKRPQ